MKGNDFQTAAARAEARYSPADWSSMSPKERSEARELRALDKPVDRKGNSETSI
jgi:hypothetical protein